MDTIKDRQRLETMHESGQAPWQHLRLDGIARIAFPALRAEPVGS